MNTSSEEPIKKISSLTPVWINQRYELEANDLKDCRQTDTQHIGSDTDSESQNLLNLICSLFFVLSCFLKRTGHAYQVMEQLGGTETGAFVVKGYHIMSMFSGICTLNSSIFYNISSLTRQEVPHLGQKNSALSYSNCSQQKDRALHVLWRHSHLSIIKTITKTITK